MPDFIVSVVGCQLRKATVNTVNIFAGLPASTSTTSLSSSNVLSTPAASSSLIGGPAAAVLVYELTVSTGRVPSRWSVFRRYGQRDGKRRLVF
jgi:hypothetical protein